MDAEVGNKRDNDLLEFEYEQLRKQVFHNNYIAHGIMAALVVASMVLLALLARQEAAHPILLAGALVVSMAALLTGHGISRRLSLSNYKRYARMQLIERQLGIFSSRIFSGESLPPDLSEEIERTSRKARGFFAGIRMNCYFSFYIWVYALTCLAILYEALHG